MVEDPVQVLEEKLAIYWPNLRSKRPNFHISENGQTLERSPWKFGKVEKVPYYETLAVDDLTGFAKAE